MSIANSNSEAKFTSYNDDDDDDDNNNTNNGQKHWYEHVPKSVETSQEDKVTILWNQHVQTDRIIPNNKPDIIIRDNEKGNMYVNRRCNLKGQKCD